MSEENKNISNSNSTDENIDTLVSETENVSVSETKTEKSENNKGKNKKRKNSDGKKKGGLKAMLSSRKTKYGSFAVATVAVVIAIVVILNVICSLLVDRFPNLKFDMTSNNAYALQEDTVDYMARLDKDVTLYILMTKSDFESGGSYTIQAQNLLEKMESNANGKFSIKYVDLSQDPTFTSRYPDIDWTSSSSNNMMLVECGSNYRLLTLEDCFDYDEETYYYYGSLQITGTKIEQAVITAILNVTTEDKVVVDIITGNGEQDYSAIKTLLENNAYQVNEISLLTNEVDEDAEAVILFAPSVDLDEASIDKLTNWLDNDGDYGKNFIYMPALDKVDTPNLDNFLSEWGMQMNDGYIFETSSDCLVSSSSPYAFIVENTDYYVDGLKNANIPVVVIQAQNIAITDENTAHALLQTSTKSGVIPYEPADDWDYQDAISGEPLYAAAEGVKTNTNESESRVVVFGSCTMFSSDVMSYNSYNNSAYFMNLVNTAVGKDDAGITIESKSMENEELGITSSSAVVIAFIIFVVAIPLIVVIIGIVMWVRRRHK